MPIRREKLHNEFKILYHHEKLGKNYLGPSYETRFELRRTDQFKPLCADVSRHQRRRQAAIAWSSYVCFRLLNRSDRFAVEDATEIHSHWE